MNILIEDADNQKYLTANNNWVTDAAEGKNFGVTKVAFLIAKKEPIGKFNIVGFIRETKQFINLDFGRGHGHS